MRQNEPFPKLYFDHIPDSDLKEYSAGFGINYVEYVGTTCGKVFLLCLFLKFG